MTRKKRPSRLSGVFLADKPSGMTSHDVVTLVRRIAVQRRVGHAGTLDPLATGLLPILLGEATKLSAWATDADKEYETTACLGIRTDTLDAEGRVTAETPLPPGLDIEAIRRQLAPFQGTITQQVPRYAAVKVDGRRLYKLARAGKDVTLPTRQVTIFQLEVLAYEPPLVSLRVRCGKGTYVRQLVADLGDALEVGAHVTALRRTRVGNLHVDEALPVSALVTDPLRGAQSLRRRLLDLPTLAGRLMPCVPCQAREAALIRQGQHPAWPRLEQAPLPPDTRFALVCDAELVAVAQVPSADEPATDRHGPIPYRLLRVFEAPSPAERDSQDQQDEPTPSA